MIVHSSYGPYQHVVLYIQTVFIISLHIQTVSLHQFPQRLQDLFAVVVKPAVNFIYFFVLYDPQSTVGLLDEPCIVAHQNYPWWCVPGGQEGGGEGSER